MPSLSRIEGLSTKEIGKKEKKSVTQPSPLPTVTPSAPVSSAAAAATKERRRWSFQRSATAVKSLDFPDPAAQEQVRRLSESEVDLKRHAVAALAVAADAAVAAVKTAAAAARLTTATTDGTNRAFKEAATIKIQTNFRSYLARKALRALRGLVKLQAMVRGHLVRKQATDTLHAMQSLVIAQARARAQRMRMVEAGHASSQQQTIHRTPNDPQFQRSNEMDRGMEEHVKIVEMDNSDSRGSMKSRNTYPIRQTERRDHSFSANYSGSQEQYQRFSPPQAALTDIITSLQYISAVSVPDSTQFSTGNSVPSYMANTESSRAKTRSQSTPRQRSDSYERQTSRRKEGRNNPRGVKMQRASSHLGLTAKGYHSPWSIELQKSSMSIRDSECGSTSTVMTNNNCRYLLTYVNQMC